MIMEIGEPQRIIEVEPEPIEVPVEPETEPAVPEQEPVPVTPS